MWLLVFRAQEKLEHWNRYFETQLFSIRCLEGIVCFSLERVINNTMCTMFENQQLSCFFF